MKKFVLYFYCLTISSQVIAAVFNLGTTENEDIVTSPGPECKRILGNITVNEDRASWNDAQLECRKAGGSLANIQSGDELQYLQQVLLEHGLTDIWFWTNSDLLTRRSLRIGFDEPDWEAGLYVQYNLDSCFMIKLSGAENNLFYFLNLDCNEYMRYICEQ